MLVMIQPSRNHLHVPYEITEEALWVTSGVEWRKRTKTLPFPITWFLLQLSKWVLQQFKFLVD